MKHHKLKEHLSIDIETYSSVDLTKAGVYAYADAPDFEILLFAYAFDDEPVEIIDVAAGEELPMRVYSALSNPTIIKTAYNANFERTCISKFYGLTMPASQWQCSSVHALELGLPPGLANVAEALGLEQRKDDRGKSLIKFFSMPYKVKESNQCAILPDNGRHMPSDAPEKWAVFKEYCKQDVEVERVIRKKLARFPVKDSEQSLWGYDQRINDRGVRVDTEFVDKAILYSGIYERDYITELKKLTGLENPKSVSQLKTWLEAETGRKITSLNKDAVKALLSADISLKARRVLFLRSRIAKTSVTKYEAMRRSMCQDGRIRGLLQFYGASRTGRWAGRIVQVQNLPQNHLQDLSLARDTVINTDFDTFEMLYGNVAGTLSELIRTALVPSEGRRFIVADFSAIEARVLSYLADENWRLEVFRTHGKIYEASAAQMFHVPVESIHKGDPLRQKGKIAELALGYGGSSAAMVNMGALDMGLDEAELKPIVDKWRAANPCITKFWTTVENAALNALDGYPTTIEHGISFAVEAGILFIGLPTGRRIAYAKPQIGTNKFGKPAITYMGVSTNNKWKRLETWGGKLTENIVQAFARDCLAETIVRLEDRGFEVNFHVHDEVILDVPYGVSNADEICEIMREPLSWAPGLPLDADGYECDFYLKS